MIPKYYSMTYTLQQVTHWRLPYLFNWVTWVLIKLLVLESGRLSEVCISSKLIVQRKST